MAVEVKLNTRVLGAKLESAETWTYAAEEWHRLYRDYVPYREGALYGNIKIVAKKNAATIVHTVPYAHYLYEGVVYAITHGGVPTGYFLPKTPKNNTGRALTYSTLYAGKATRHWDEAAKPTRMPLLLRSLEAHIKAKL